MPQQSCDAEGGHNDRGRRRRKRRSKNKGIFKINRPGDKVKKIKDDKSLASQGVDVNFVGRDVQKMMQDILKEKKLTEYS